MIIDARPDTMFCCVSVDYEKARFKAKEAETKMIILSEPEELERCQRSR